jgi:hypothetical protein
MGDMNNANAQKESFNELQGMPPPPTLMTATSSRKRHTPRGLFSG